MHLDVAEGHLPVLPIRQATTSVGTLHNLAMSRRGAPVACGGAACPLCPATPFGILAICVPATGVIVAGIYFRKRLGLTAVAS